LFIVITQAVYSFIALPSSRLGKLELLTEQSMCFGALVRWSVPIDPDISGKRRGILG
jgi:hypothetical protein